MPTARPAMGLGLDHLVAEHGPDMSIATLPRIVAADYPRMPGRAGAFPPARVALSPATNRVLRSN
jgi:hypothetical protein